MLLEIQARCVDAPTPDTWPTMSPGERLQRLRKQRGFSAAALAKKAGVAASTVRAHESGQNQIHADVAATYAHILEVQPEFILFGAKMFVSAENTEVRMVPVLGNVQAGAWHEIPDEPTVKEYIPFIDPQYRRASNIYALDVRGPSMNLEYPDPSRIVVVDAVEAGVREGDHVVVRRRKGSFVETTLKEVVIGTGGRVELWPRSTDPNFQEPFIIERARDADDGPEIIAVVIGAYKTRPPRSGTLVL